KMWRVDIRMWRAVKALTVVVAAQILVPCIPPASAHHLMGGKLPGNAWEGFLSGLGHPIIGPDHFAFVVGVGLISQLAGRLALLPLLAVLGTIAGCYAHMQSLWLPWSEAMIGLSLVFAAVLVLVHRRISSVVLAIVFAISGALHGYAYGESIVGAEAASLSAYIMGFAAIQYAVAVASGATFGLVVGRNYIGEKVALGLAATGLAL